MEEAFTATVTITPTNATEGTDFSVDSKDIVFAAGEVKSEPLLINIIDNAISNPGERSLDITISSVSNPNIDIGVGIVNQSNKTFILNIQDDECTETIADVFNATDLINNQTTTISGTVTGDKVLLQGDLIGYAPFSNAQLEVTLTPDVAGGTKGTASFADYDAGTDSDGYVYQFRPVDTGNYDVCSGTISISFDVYYESGGNWVYWYTSDNTITAP